MPWPSFTLVGGAQRQSCCGQTAIQAKAAKLFLGRLTCSLLNCFAPLAGGKEPFFHSGTSGDGAY